MGGAVSHGVDNNDLIDKLCEAGYIRSPEVTFALRAVDRALYFPEGRENLAYRDLAYKNGDVHLSAPCIYCEVLEGLELRNGLSFLNIGSGTGYLSTVAGLILCENGTNHGIEVCSNLVRFAENKMQLFLQGSMPSILGVEFCDPVFVVGNGLCLNPYYRQYDRVYCGAAVSSDYEDYMKSLVKVGGILIMPFDDKVRINQGKCVLSLSENHTHVENLTGNSWEKYRSSGRNQTHALLSATLEAQ